MASIQGGPGPHGEFNQGLLLIGLFKLSKALLFFSIGVGALHFLHKDLGDEVLRIANDLHFDSEHHFVDFLLTSADKITPHRLKEIGLATFTYSALSLTEGIGLMRKKVWAEYLTLTLTISFLPLEFFELVKGVNWFRIAMIVINIVVLLYLIWLIQRKRAAQESV